MRSDPADPIRNERAPSSSTRRREAAKADVPVTPGANTRPTVGCSRKHRVDEPRHASGARHPRTSTAAISFALRRSRWPGPPESLTWASASATQAGGSVCRFLASARVATCPSSALSMAPTGVARSALARPAEAVTSAPNGRRLLPPSRSRQERGEPTSALPRLRSPGPDRFHVRTRLSAQMPGGSLCADSRPTRLHEPGERESTKSASIRGYRRDFRH